MWIVVSKKVFLITLMIVGTITAVVLSTTIMPLETFFCATFAQKDSYVAIIIDDFGNNAEGTDAMLQLGVPLTAAVMPYLPYSSYDAQRAHDAGMEVILHLPMQPENGKASWLGPMGITVDLKDNEIRARIKNGLKQLKWAKGISNHMGSKAMQDKRVVKLVLEVVKQNNLYFVDSKTTPYSVASEIAQTLNVPLFERDVFLDNSKKLSDIQKQIDKLATIALKKGYAIGIGHVGSEGGTVTALAIQSKIPTLKKYGIKLIYVSQLAEIMGKTDSGF